MPRKKPGVPRTLAAMPFSLKPSELATACSAAAARLVPKYFDPQAVAVVEDAVAETTALLAQSWGFPF